VHRQKNRPVHDRILLGKFEHADPDVEEEVLRVLALGAAQKFLKAVWISASRIS
jgi:hypothetical protein